MKLSIHFGRNTFLSWVSRISLIVLAISVLILTWGLISKNPWLYLLLSAIIVAVLVTTKVITFGDVAKGLKSALPGSRA